MSASLQTIAADAHIAEEHFYIHEETLNKVKYLMCQAGTGRPTVSKTQGQNSEPR
jgi:hypothetical protein